MAKSNAVKEILSVGNKQFVIGDNANAILSLNGRQYPIVKTLPIDLVMVNNE